MVALAAAACVLALTAPVAGSSTGARTGQAAATGQTAVASTFCGAAPEGSVSVASVVDTGSGSVSVRCVVVPAGSTGFDVLRAAGHSLRLDGGFLCGIDGLPSTGCGRDPSADAFWSYWRADPGGAWTFSRAGAGATRVPARCAVQGWRWTSRNVVAPPPRVAVPSVACERPTAPTVAPAPTPPPTRPPRPAAPASPPSPPRPPVESPAAPRQQEDPPVPAAPDAHPDGASDGASDSASDGEGAAAGEPPSGPGPDDDSGPDDGDGAAAAAGDDGRGPDGGQGADGHVEVAGRATPNPADSGPGVRAVAAVPGAGSSPVGTAVGLALIAAVGAAAVWVGRSRRRADLAPIAQGP